MSLNCLLLINKHFKIIIKTIEKLTIAFIKLTKDDVNNIINKARIARKNAIKIAKVYNLDKEIIWLIDFCGYTPEEALREFDLL